MSDLGAVLVSKKAGFGAILGLAAIGLPAAALWLFMLANLDWRNPTQDDFMGLGMVGVFALIGCGGLFLSVRLRFDICENGIRARKLFSSFELPFSQLRAISVKRTSANQTDLLSGKTDLGYSVVVWNEAGVSADFQSAGFGSDAAVEQAVEKMQDLLAARWGAQLDQGQPVEWMPGVTINRERVRGQLQQHLLTRNLLESAPPPMDLFLDDEDVVVSLQGGTVTILWSGKPVASFGCDTPNYFPGERVLRERSAWQFS